MINEKVATRYARALFEIGREQNQTEQFLNELKTFYGLFQKVPDLEKSLLSPLYKTEDQKKIALRVADKIKASKVIQNFITLLIDKQRILYLNNIIEAYEKLTDELSGYAKARIITATTLSQNDYTTIEKFLENSTKKKVILTTVVEPQIIGGVIVEVGDKIFDGSLRNQIRKIGETLT